MTFSDTRRPRHLDGMRMTQSMWRKAPPHTGVDRCAAQLLTSAASSQRSSAGATVDDAEQRPDGHLDAVDKPWGMRTIAGLAHHRHDLLDRRGSAG
jgi:hypothetical protein